MKFLLRILDLVVVSNVFVALSVASLSCVSFLKYDHINWHYVLFLFFATIFSYNFMRLIRIDKIVLKEVSHRHQLMHKYKSVLWMISLLALGLCIYHFGFIHNSILFYLILLSVISVFYVFPVYKHKGRWLLLREVPFIKLFLIAIVWAFVSEGLPSILSTGSLNFLQLFERALFVAAITIPFDIRDVKHDSVAIATLPLVFGVEKSKLIAMILMLFAECLVFSEYWFFSTISLASFIGVYLVYELTTFVIYKVHENRGERYFTVLIEGLPIVLLFVFYLSKIM